MYWIILLAINILNKSHLNVDDAVEEVDPRTIKLSKLNLELSKTIYFEPWPGCIL